MKITSQEEYGLRCILQLASHPPGEPLSVSEIARREGLSVAYVEKLLRILSRAGLVRSQRGTKGGYELVGSRGEVSLGRVARALGGMQSSEQICQRHSGNLEECVHKDNCGIQPVWQGITDYILDVMDQITLGDILDGRNLSQQLYRPAIPVMKSSRVKKI